MTSHDVRDVLNLPADTGGPLPTKKPKNTAPRPNLKGLAREVQNLTVGDNPIAIVPEISIKKKRFVSKKPAVKWELCPFQNSARHDNGSLILRHWRRKPDHDLAQDVAMDVADPVSLVGEDSGVVAQTGTTAIVDSDFTKYNVRVAVPQYSDEQYRTNLEDPEWTKEETDYLLELTRDFDLRWPIIWDRYVFEPPPSSPSPPERSMEALKARYYAVAAKMMALHKLPTYMTRAELEHYNILNSFNPAQEAARKRFAANSMSRSKEEAALEEALLIEVKRIMARNERLNEERRVLYRRLDYPHTDQDISSFKSSAGMQTLLQDLCAIDKSKKRKSLAGLDGISPSYPSSARPESAGGPNRRDSIALSTHGSRDPLSAASATADEDAKTAPTTTTASRKKGGAAQPPERRKLTEHEMQLYGVSYHDRLGSGPTFRYEKINKLYNHKSNQQTMRILNVLAELGLPPRLAMPTAAVTTCFESLWQAVVSGLVDMRKLEDKLDAEIKIEEAKKAERERRARDVKLASSSRGDSRGEERTAANVTKASVVSKKGGADEGSGVQAQPSPSVKREMGEGTAHGESNTPAGQEAEPDFGAGSGTESSSETHKRAASVLSASGESNPKRLKK